MVLDIFPVIGGLRQAVYSYSIQSQSVSAVTEGPTRDEALYLHLSPGDGKFDGCLKQALPYFELLMAVYSTRLSKFQFIIHSFPQCNNSDKYILNMKPRSKEDCSRFSAKNDNYTYFTSCGWDHVSYIMRMHVSN